MQVQYWSLSNNQDTHPNTAHTKPPPSHLPFDRWPFHTGHVLQDRRVSSHYSQGQRRMTRNLLPSEAVSMGVRHRLIMAGVNGAGLGSSLETSTWDCHQTIKSIIFSFRSQDLCNGLSLACMMATFIASVWKDNEWEGENRQKDLQHNNKGQ